MKLTCNKKNKIKNEKISNFDHTEKLGIAQHV